MEHMARFVVDQRNMEAANGGSDLVDYSPEICEMPRTDIVSGSSFGRVHQHVSRFQRFLTSCKESLDNALDNLIV